MLTEVKVSTRSQVPIFSFVLGRMYNNKHYSEPGLCIEERQPSAPYCSHLELLYQCHPPPPLGKWLILTLIWPGVAPLDLYLPTLEVCHY